jgi:hypothetical protein
MKFVILFFTVFSINTLALANDVCRAAADQHHKNWVSQQDKYVVAESEHHKIKYKGDLSSAISYLESYNSDAEWWVIEESIPTLKSLPGTGYLVYEARSNFTDSYSGDLEGYSSYVIVDSSCSLRLISRVFAFAFYWSAG